MKHTLFGHELKAYRNNFVFWSVGIIVFIAASMAKYSGLSSSGQSANELIAQLPSSVQALFGLNGLDIATIDGYFGVLFMYLALMAAIHAVLIGSDIIAKEERDRTSEFLYSKPRSRAALLTQKLLAGIAYIIAFNVVICLSSLYLVSLYNTGESIANYIVTLMYAIFAIQITFYSLGVAVAAISRRPKLSASIASSLLLVTYVLYFLININPDLEPLKFLTPFKYFDAVSILETGSLQIGYVALSAGIVALLISSSYSALSKRDITV